MKRFFVAALVSVLCVSLASCNGAGDKVPDTQKSGNGENNSAFSADETGASTSSTSTTPDIVVVPNVVGMDKDEAVSKLKAAGLVVKTKNRYVQYGGESMDSKPLPENQVVSQTYQAGLTVMRNTEIEIGYTTHQSSFEHKELKNGTVRLFLSPESKLFVEDKTITIPDIYEGKTVSALSSTQMFIYKYPPYEDYVFRIPKNVEILDEEEWEGLNIVRY